jgi:hypothetical protein
MRKMFLSLCVAVALMAGCTEPEIPILPVPPMTTENGEETTVTFNFYVDNPATATRAVDETAITDLQLLLIASDGTRYFYEPGDKKSVTAQIKRTVYTVYACTNNPVKIEKLDEALINFLWTPVYKETDTSFVMTFKGSADFSVGKPDSYTVQLVRTVAKLRFNVNVASNITIKKMSLRNAPSQTKLFPQALPGYNYVKRTIAVPANGSFTLYMPENLAGTVASITDQKQRTAANAPKYATHLKIEGDVVTSNGSGSFDRKSFESVVYLGSNVTDDFNIKRNTDYRINIDIAADLTGDYRIELNRVGHRILGMSPDGRYLAYGSATLKPFLVKDEQGWGDKQITFRYVFEGNDLSNMKVGGATLTGENTYSGTLDATRNTASVSFNLAEPVYTPEKHSVKYTLTFTDQTGVIAQYKEELKCANRTTVQTLPIAGVPPSERTANIIVSPDYSVAPEGSFTYIVFHTTQTLQLTVEP